MIMALLWAGWWTMLSTRQAATFECLKYAHHAQPQQQPQQQLVAGGSGSPGMSNVYLSVIKFENDLNFTSIFFGIGLNTFFFGCGIAVGACDLRPAQPQAHSLGSSSPPFPSRSFCRWGPPANDKQRLAIPLPCHSQIQSRNRNRNRSRSRTQPPEQSERSIRLIGDLFSICNWLMSDGPLWGQRRRQSRGGAKPKVASEHHSMRTVHSRFIIIADRQWGWLCVCVCLSISLDSNCLLSNANCECRFEFVSHLPRTCIPYRGCFKRILE